MFYAFIWKPDTEQNFWVNKTFHKAILRINLNKLSSFYAFK